MEYDSFGRICKALFLPTLTLVAIKQLDMPESYRFATTSGSRGRFPWYELDRSGNSFVPEGGSKGDFDSVQSNNRCPYLVKIYGYYIDPDKDTLNLVREYLYAGSMQEKIDGGEILNVDDAAVLAYSVLRALKVLHESRIVHHEVRPTNMLINMDGCVKLTQYGFVRGM
jgi:serine/threonine protein kinase